MTSGDTEQLIGIPNTCNSEGTDIVLLDQTSSNETRKKLFDELEVINTSLKGKNTIESASLLADIATSNSREDLFKIVKELYTFSKKTLSLTSAPQANVNCVDAEALNNIIKNQLADVLPGLLKNALETTPDTTATRPTSKTLKEDVTLPVRHTLLIERKTDEQNDNESFTDTEWSTVVQRNVKGVLEEVPVQKVSVRDGKPSLTFSDKESLDKAALALEKEYKVSPKSEERKKLNPKLTISDINSDIKTTEELENEIYQKNENIKTLKDAGHQMKIIFYDVKQRYAVIQVSPEIRDSIRQKDDRIYLNLERYFVRDRIHVIQCYHCLEYGHMSGSPYCRQKAMGPTCFFCAGNHASKSCTVKSVKDKHKCSNCQKSRKSLERASASTHKASDNLCPFYVKERGRLMSRTAGCEEAKNEYLKRAKELQKRLGRI